MTRPCGRRKPWGLLLAFKGAHPRLTMTRRLRVWGWDVGVYGGGDGGHDDGLVGRASAYMMHVYMYICMYARTLS